MNISIFRNANVYIYTRPLIYFDTFKVLPFNAHRRIEISKHFSIFTYSKRLQQP